MIGVIVQAKGAWQTLIYIAPSGSPFKVYDNYQAWHQNRLRGFLTLNEHWLRCEKIPIESVSKLALIPFG